MGFLSSYIKNIAVFLIFITLVGIISPSNKYKKYINLTLGFILIFVIITPITGLMKNNNLNINNLMVSMSYNPSLDEGGVSQNELIIKELEGELEKQMGLLLKGDENYTLESAIFDIDNSTEGFGSIKKIGLILNEKAGTKKRGIIRVEKIVVSETPKENIGAGGQEKLNEIKNIVSGFYNLSVENIYITVQ
ncbi:MAG: stage III sporulation protein AF [Clostridiales bacterium]|nr:stage III sporulation protein AF [Clostridiales bacterium]